MPTAAFTTLGCKVNQYETQKILDSFAEVGFEIVPFEGPADVYVVNSCSVTSDAERKSRYTIRRAKRFNSEAKVVVTGCAAQMSLNRGEAVECADLLVPNPDKLKSWQYFASEFPEMVPHKTAKNRVLGVPGRTRATLKVQDGCNVMCSYCSIPYTRPGMVSRPAKEVLREAKLLAETGYHEAILTGVLIGAYDESTGSGGPDFNQLVKLLSEESGLARLRISSIEVHQVTPELIALAQQGLIAPHFHIPLQSGDSGVLKDMNRRYDQAKYIELCLRLKREIPDVTLTTDIMVGFPTESRERFESSLHVCETVGFHSAHVFTFSPRWGTPADAWGDPVSPEEKSARRLELVKLTGETGRAHVAKFVGQTMRVLVEGKIAKDGMLQGLTDNYLTVKYCGPITHCRTLQQVRLVEASGMEVFGELAGESAPSLRVLA